MRLGLTVEYEGKNYDILELPVEAFVRMVPGLTEDQFDFLDKQFTDFWPEPTQRRNHLLAFAAELSGSTLDFLLLNRDSIQFDETDVMAYIEEHMMQGNRPN